MSQNIAEQVKALEGAERQVVRALDATTERVNAIGTTRVEQALERLQTACAGAQGRIQDRLQDATNSLGSLLAFCSSVEDGVLGALSTLDVAEPEVNGLWDDGIGPMPLPIGEEPASKARRGRKRLN